MGLFDNSGLVLGIAGPSGTILAYGLVAAAVVCIMEGVSEMIGHWPISNAMIEFVRSFVDKDLAMVVGFAYWYASANILSDEQANMDRASYSISFATLIVAAANLATYWEWANFWQSAIFIFFLPAILLVLNCLGVKARPSKTAPKALFETTLIRENSGMVTLRALPDFLNSSSFCSHLLLCWPLTVVVCNPKLSSSVILCNQTNYL